MWLQIEILHFLCSRRTNSQGGIRLARRKVPGERQWRPLFSISVYMCDENGMLSPIRVNARFHWKAPGRLGSQVEQEEQALCVASLGVRYAQGFWFFRPSLPEVAWLSTHRCV